MNELDGEWKGLLRAMTPFRRAGEDDGSKDYDPYDMLVKQMGFEKKEARGGERMKTDEEKVKEERERLQSLEEDRMRRMRGEKVEKKHVSVEDMGEENYKKTEKITQKERRRLLKELLRGEPETEEGDEEDEEEESSNEDGEEGDEEEESGDDSGEDSGEESDKFSDLAESDEEDNEPANEKDVYDANIEAMIIAASEEIPYIIPVPESYPTLCALVWGKAPPDMDTVLGRILACNHPQLGDHKPALVSYYQFLLQLVQDIALSPDPLPSLSTIFPHIFKLTAMFQQQAATSLLQVISDKYDQFNSLVRPRYPGLDTIMFLHLVHIIFPSSDYRHPVVTPSVTFMCSIMATARPIDRSSISSCLLVCTTMLEYVSLSKRFVPELVNTLHGLLFVSSTSHTTRPPPPCKGGNYLVLSNKIDKIDNSKLDISEVSSVKDIDDNFRVSALSSTLTLLIKTLKLYREIPSSWEIFSPLIPPLQNIKTDIYPGEVGEKVEQVILSISSLNKRRKPVVKPAKQVPMLRMMEPKIEEGFEPFKKKRQGSKEMLEEQKNEAQIEAGEERCKKRNQTGHSFFGISKDEGSQDEGSGEARQDQGTVFQSCKPGRGFQENVKKEEKVLKRFFPSKFKSIFF